jgi:hypothetical protein
MQSVVNIHSTSDSTKKLIMRETAMQMKHCQMIGSPSIRSFIISEILRNIDDLIYREKSTNLSRYEKKIEE